MVSEISPPVRGVIVQSWLKWVERRLPATFEGRVAGAMLVGVAGLVATMFTMRVFMGDAPIDRFFDDFFYYLTPVENWIETGRATFSSGESANGYHPLWFLWLSLLQVIAGGSNALFFGLVDFSIAALLIGALFLFDRFLFVVTDNRIAAALGAGVATILLADHAGTGVEMALAGCAVAGLMAFLAHKPLAEFDLRDAALAGLLGAVAVLSRLDAVMLALTLPVVALLRWDVRRMAAAVAGATPLFGYFAFNLIATGHLSTTAMAAKSLKTVSAPDLAEILSHDVAVGTIAAGAATIIILLVGRKDEVRVDARRLAMAFAVAPLLQFLSQSAMSGWTLFIWYFYLGFMVIGLSAACALGWISERLSGRWAASLLALLVLVIIAPKAFYREPVTSGPHGQIARMGRWVDEFSRAHPGVYAMGDGAGVSSWMLDQPLVHLEGLMMPHEFHERIRAERPLEETFRDYGVSYYITNKSARDLPNGCLEFAEPSPKQTLAKSPVMRMTTCVEPVASFVSAFPRFQPRIFRIDPATGKAIAP